MHGTIDNKYHGGTISTTLKIPVIIAVKTASQLDHMQFRYTPMAAGKNQFKSTPRTMRAS